MSYTYLPAIVFYSEPDVSQGFSPASFIVLFVCLSVFLSVCLMSQKGVYESTGHPGGGTSVTVVMLDKELTVNIAN